MNADKITVSLEKTSNAFEIMKAAAKKQETINNAKRTFKDLKNTEKEEEKCSFEGEEEDPKEAKKKVLRRRYSQKEKEKILENYVDLGKTHTMIKFGVPEGTLKSIVTKFNKDGEDTCEDTFEDKRKI